MIAPILRPAQSSARSDHRAADIARLWRNAPGGSSRALRPSDRGAAHGRPLNQAVTMRADPTRRAYQPRQRVARGLRGRLRAWLTAPAAAVHLARGDPGKPHMRPFGAPDRPIAIPHRNRGASEHFAIGDDR